MLSVLLEGTLTAAPVSRTSSKGATYATAQMRCAGEDGQTVWCSVITFHETAVDTLIGLASGDALAVAGQAALTQWEKNGEHRVGLKVTATRVMSVYEAGQRRKASTPLQSTGRGDPGYSDRDEAMHD